MNKIDKLYKRIMKHDPKVIDDIKSSKKLQEDFSFLLNCCFLSNVLEDVDYEVFYKMKEEKLYDREDSLCCI